MRLANAALAVLLPAMAMALYVPPWIDPKVALLLDRPEPEFRHRVPWRPSLGLIDQQEVLYDQQDKQKVNITLGVMSRCPDAELCEGLFDKVLDSVGNLVNFELSYIGKVDSHEEYGIKCKHGPGECLGNIHQLCVKEAFPDASVWFSTFVDCVNYGKQGDEDSARECARLAGIDWDESIAACVGGKQGRELLRRSVLHSQELGIERSCSILFNDRLVCVRDDGEWVDCDRHDVADFTQRVRKLYNRQNP